MSDTKKDKTQNVVQIKLGVLLLVMFLLGLAGMYQIRGSNESMSRNVEINIAKIKLANVMRDAIRLRQIGLNKLLSTDDPFERDEGLLHYYEYAGQYRNARNKLIDLPMDAKEKAIQEELTNITRVSQPLNKKAAEMIAQEAPDEQIRQVAANALHEQQKLLLQLDKLVSLQNRYANGALQQGRNQYDSVLMVMLVLSVLVIAVAFLVVRRLSKYIAENNQKLLDNNEELARASSEALAATQAKSAFLATMSHEIRTPLTAMIGFAEASLDQGRTEEDHRAAAKNIVRNGNHLLQIINDILDLSRIETKQFKLEPVEMSPFAVLSDIEALIKPQVHVKGLAFEIDYEFPLPQTIISDPMRIKQVLVNLCNNALKFTDYGQIMIVVTYDQTAQQIVFNVHDSGIGMTDAQIEKIFDVFTQADSSTSRKYGGTGLGLSLCKQLVEAMGGSITVKSLPGTGSRFIVRINTGHENTRLVHSEGEIFSCEYEPQDPLALTPLQGKVLLADDNADNQQLISYFVEKMGPRVVLAHNGQIALDLVSNCDFDLVLMDIQMPVMNGIDAVRKIREKGKQLPIIALTANASNEDREACLAVGCNDFLTKPVDRHKLYEVLSEYLGKKSSGQAKNLYSTVLDEEPELSDLVEKYCHRLPGLVEQFKQSLHEGDMSGLQKMSHDLKGTGGGMGFPALTDIAAAIESRLREQDVENLGVLIEELENIVHRIIQGMVESKAAGRNGKPDASHDAA